MLAQPAFVEMCARELTLCGVHEGETVAILSQGDTNTSPCHLDIPMRGCSLYLDGEPILRDGEFTVPELCAPGRNPVDKGGST